MHPLVSEEGRRVYVAEVKLCHSGAIDDPGASHQWGGSEFQVQLILASTLRSWGSIKFPPIIILAAVI